MVLLVEAAGGKTTKHEDESIVYDNSVASGVHEKLVWVIYGDSASEFVSSLVRWAITMLNLHG